MNGIARSAKRETCWGSSLFSGHVESSLDVVADDKGDVKTSRAGDPLGEVRMTWHAKETVRGLYGFEDPGEAAMFVDEPIDDTADRSSSPEVRSLAGTLRRWRDHIIARRARNHGAAAMPLCVALTMLAQKAARWCPVHFDEGPGEVCRVGESSVVGSGREVVPLVEEEVACMLQPEPQTESVDWDTHLA